jgi:hypothetical protein
MAGNFRGKKMYKASEQKKKQNYNKKIQNLREFNKTYDNIGTSSENALSLYTLPRITRIALAGIGVNANSVVTSPK